VIGIIPGVENMPLQIRRGTDAERLAMTQPLAQGELLYVTNDQRLYIGNGSTLGGVQITGYTDENAQDAAAQLFSNGAHTGITFTYNDASASISAALNLSNFAGTISADAFKGSVFGDDSTPMVDAINNTFNGSLSGNVTGNLTGNVTGNVAGVITGTAGSTLVGNVTGNVTGNVVGNVTGNLVGNVTGNLDGDINGSVFSDTSTMLVDGVTGTLSNGTITLSDDTITVAANTEINFGNFTTRNRIEIYSYNTEAGLTVNAELAGAPGITQQGAFLRIKSTNGTFSSQAVLGAGDLLGQLQFAGYVNGGAGGAQTADLAVVRAVVSDPGDLVSNFASGKLQFFIGDQDNPGNSKIAEFNDVGVFSAPVLKPGVYANNAARDAAITAPAAGMIVFNTTGTKFQGYTGAAWVDLN
jgi:hypothetical protein